MHPQVQRDQYWGYTLLFPGLLAFEPCCPFPTPQRGWDVVGKIWGTLCHKPLFISLFSWSVAYICSKLAFQETAFQVKATVICLTTLKLFCFLWPEWDHELFFFPEEPSKYYMTLRIIHCMQESERHRRHCACPWKYKFILKETERKQNKSTKVEHNMPLKNSKGKCSEWKDMKLYSKEVLKWLLEGLREALYLETYKGEKSEIFII